jgi:Protein of unknown function (DUF1176)
MLLNLFKVGVKVGTIVLIVTQGFVAQPAFAGSPSAKVKAEGKLTPYQSRLVNRLKQCPISAQPDALARSQFFRVANGKYIVQVMCMLGAYQGGYEYYLLTETGGKTQSKPLNLLKVWEDGGKKMRLEDNTLGGLPTYNAANRELTVFNKARGLGDCGTFGRYKFENDRFVAQEIRAKSECDGKYIEPEQYKQVYP